MPWLFLFLKSTLTLLYHRAKCEVGMTFSYEDTQFSRAVRAACHQHARQRYSFTRSIQRKLAGRRSPARPPTFAPKGWGGREAKTGTVVN
eukprot:scaffold11631_cov54-Cylindrotheca_fusiformis.AAC.1